MNIQFAVNSYRSASLPVSAQRLVNMYAERQPPDAKTQVAVFGCPGIVLFSSVGEGPIRGMHVMGGTLYVVSGGRLYSVTSAGVATDIGGNISGDGIVSMEDNGTQLTIVNGTNGYLYSSSLGFVLITDTDFSAANTVVFLNQRFVFDEKSTNRFFISGSLDGTSYDADQVASAESRSDNVVAVVVNQQTLLVFGEKSIELWQDVGAANFPFERVPGGVIERGLAAAQCTAKEDNTVFFLGDDRIFYRLDGLTPKRVSTHAIEHIWRDYASVSDAFAFAHDFAGHKFVTVTFPTANATWVFDISTGLWHERESWNVHGVRLGRWRGNTHATAYGYELIGDALSGRIGYLSSSTYTEYGNTIQGYSVCPPIHSDRKRIFIPRFELDVESGVGLTTGQGSDPQIMLDWSKDGGRTFSERQLWKSAGALGQYRKRLKWDRLGSSRDWVFRVTVSDPVRRTIIAAHADITVGL